MKLLCNILLGICAALSIALLILQGFFIPILPGWACVLLRLLAAICVQYLLLRIAHNKTIQAIPVMITGILSVLGFFLYLTAPSWLGITFRIFLSEYAIFLFGCMLVWLLHFFQPQLRRLRKLLKRRMKKRRRKK